MFELGFVLALMVIVLFTIRACVIILWDRQVDYKNNWWQRVKTALNPWEKNKK